MYSLSAAETLAVRRCLVLLDCCAAMRACIKMYQYDHRSVARYVHTRW